MPKTATPVMTEIREWWILTGGFFRNDGHRLYSGPYSTDGDAFTARVTLERLRGANDLWVDDRVAPENSIIHDRVSDPQRRNGE